MLMDDRLFSQTVTVYRLQDGQVLRQEIENCHMYMQTFLQPHVHGSRLRKDFTLIIPGNRADLQPGDLVYHGIGPVITGEGWQDFVPAAVPHLAQAEYVQPVYFNGQVHHIQAGTARKTWR